MQFLQGTHAGDTAEWIVGLLLAAGVVGALIFAFASGSLDGLMRDWRAELSALTGP